MKFNLKHFAIKLIKNSKDLEPMYSKFINDHFWELTSNFRICSTKIQSTGEHCPEEGLFQIDDSGDYLCSKCYENYISK